MNQLQQVDSNIVRVKEEREMLLSHMEQVRLAGKQHKILYTEFLIYRSTFKFILTLEKWVKLW